jgi:hypothetical protein
MVATPTAMALVVAGRLWTVYHEAVQVNLTQVL